jgi:HD superfamily phosphohydrolase
MERFQCQTICQINCANSTRFPHRLRPVWRILFARQNRTGNRRWNRWHHLAEGQRFVPTAPTPELSAGTRFPVTGAIRDALYDLIPTSDPEIAVIGTRAFLRLERIQQLGFVSRVWPGAKHARYEHSLGVLHLTRLALAHLRRWPAGAGITDEDARVVAAAALLHDIGHYPFSHAIEELGPPVRSHEAVGRQMILGSEIATILERDWGVNPERVACFIYPGADELPPVDRLLRGILSGPLDVDKLDYLPRDAAACHVPYGGVDTARLIDSLRVAEVGEEGQQRIVVGEKGVSPLHSLINARQEMFDNVYWHHTNRACMAMLLRAIQEGLLAGAIDADELTQHDDASLLAFLSQPDMPASTRRLTDALRDRRFHKRAVEISSRASDLHTRLGALFHNPGSRRLVELALVDRLREMTGEDVPEEAILIDIPKPEKWRTDVWVQFETPPIGFQSLMAWRDVVGLGDDDLKRYEEHRRLIRLVAADPYREAVRENWEQLLYPLIGGML